MDRISSQCYKISSKLNGKIRKKINMKDPDEYEMFQENNLAEIKHVVKSKRKDAPSQNSDELSKTVFKNISNIRVNVNCKTDHKSHNWTKKASKNITENYARFYRKHNKYVKTRNGTFYSVSSVYSSETKKSSINLFYCNNKKEVNKAIFYRDICITGEKIALWRKLKKKISSLTSTVKDDKFHMDNFSKQQSQINRKYKESDTCGANKTKFKPFLQRFWNYYCKCDEAKNTKCNKVPVIQFPDLPEHCLYKKCSCLKQRSDQCIFKSRYSCDIISSNHIVKSSKTEIGISCGEPNIVATREVCCDTNSARFDTYTDMSEHILLNKSTQYIEQEIEMKSHELIIIEKRCASTQDDIQVECGDQNRETNERNKFNLKNCLQNCLSTQFTNNGNNICDKGKSLIKKLNRKYIDSIKCKPQKKHYTRKTQTCLNSRKAMKSGTDEKKILFRNLEKSIGIQCATSNAKCQTLEKYQRTKKVAVKTTVRNKSGIYKLPLPGLSTKKTQCVQQPPICKLQKHNNLVGLCKKFSCSKMKKPTCKLCSSKRCKCTKKSVLIKSCEKCTSNKKTHKISVMTQCPVVKMPIRDGNNSYKEKFWKHRISKISDHTMEALKKFKNSKENNLGQKSCSRKLMCKKACHSIGIQCCPPKPTICTCTKDLYFSKSCNNILSRKRPTCSIGTQENKRHILQNLHKIKNNLSLFNLKKSKTLEPCRCIESLMFINEAYRNYYINPAMVSQIKRCEKKCLFYNQDRKDLIYAKMRRALISELKKKYVNRSIQCKVKPCANCKWKQNVCSITPCSKYSPVSTCRHCCSAYCKPCYSLPSTLTCRSILSKNASKCKNAKKCMNKGLSSKTHHCERSTIHRIRCHVRKFFRLSIFDKESGCRRKCGRRSKVQDDPNKIFLKTVRKPRYTRIYRLCPWAYPECLKCLDIWKQNIQIILVIITWILWCPCIILMELFRLCCCYFCYK